MIDELTEKEAQLIAKMKMDLSKTLLDFKHRWNISSDMAIRLFESATADYWLVHRFMTEYRAAKAGRST